jgi:hypothetical protein
MPTRKQKHYIVSCSYGSKRHAGTAEATFLGQLLPALEQASGIPVIGIAPFHRNLPGFAMLLATTVAPSYRGASVPIEVLQDAQDHRWFYLRQRDTGVCAWLGEPPFFNGRPDNLYRVSDRDEAENTRLLLRDVLLFGSAVRQAVALLVGAIPATWLLHEWQGAACLLGHPQSGDVRFQLLLRSSYDSGALPDDLLRDFGIDPDTCPGPGPSPGGSPTVLERALRLLPRERTGHESINALRDGSDA